MRRGFSPSELIYILFIQAVRHYQSSDVDSEEPRVQNLALPQGPKRPHPRARRRALMPNTKSQGTFTAPSRESLQESNVQNLINLNLNIDSLLGRAARSLIELAAPKCQPDKDAHQDICHKALYFPPWNSASGTPATEKFLLTRALCWCPPYLAEISPGSVSCWIPKRSSLSWGPGAGQKARYVSTKRSQILLLLQLVTDGFPILSSGRVVNP